jgi:xylulokinase
MMPVVGNVLGLDLGTSAVKALFVGEDGRVGARGRAPCRVDSPAPGWAESDPRRWLASAGKAVRQAGDRRVDAIGLSGQMHGVVLCDEAGDPVRPAILWADRRALAQAARWPRAGNPVGPGFAGPILAWLAEHDPGALERARWALQPKDWLRLALGCPAATEPSDASATLLWDADADRWAAVEGVDPRLLAPVRRSAEPAGALSAAGADALGLPAGTPIVHGAADTAAAWLGAGGGRILNVGTGAQLVAPVRATALDEPRCHRFRAAGPGWYALAAVQNAGLAIDWARRILDAEPAAPGDASGPLFVPHLTGERTPLLDPAARGGWVGLSLATDRSALLHSVPEGVAFGIRWARDSLAVEAGSTDGSLRLLGGGSLAPGFAQLLADVLGEPLELLEVPDASALGAALLAGAPEHPRRVIDEVRPRKQAARRLDERFAAWLAAVRALR